MNKIYKKIWNKARGCFVAVSEVVAAASKKGGKNALVGTITLLLPLSSYAVQTINGDVELGTLKESEKNTLRDSYIINGNATAFDDFLHVSWTSKDYHGMENQTLTVNGNLTVTSPYMVITHRGDGASQITGGLHVRDNLYLDAGLLRVGSGNSHDGGTVTTSFSVGGTLRVAQGSTIDNRPDYFHVHLNMSAGNLSSAGTLNNRGSWAETNAFTITGNLNNTGAINFQNGFTFASNGKLNSSGTIQTNNASNIFDSLGSQRETALTSVSLNSQLPEETKTALTDLFRHYVPGSVAQNLIDHAKFTGGKVIVTGVNLTQTQAADLMEAFKSKFFLLPGVSISSFSQECRLKSLNSFL